MGKRRGALKRSGYRLRDEKQIEANRSRIFPRYFFVRALSARKSPGIGPAVRTTSGNNERTNVRTYVTYFSAKYATSDHVRLRDKRPPSAREEVTRRPRWSMELIFELWSARVSRVRRCNEFRQFTEQTRTRSLARLVYGRAGKTPTRAAANTCAATRNIRPQCCCPESVFATPTNTHTHIPHTRL